jgi:hypothetical protein
VRFSLCDGIRKEERGWNVLSGMVCRICIFHSNCHGRVSPERVDQLINSIILLFPWSQVDKEAADARSVEGNAMGGGQVRGAQTGWRRGRLMRGLWKGMRLGWSMLAGLAKAAWKLDRRRICTGMAASTQANPQRQWK